MASENFKKHSSAEEVEGEAAGAGASCTSLTAQIHVSWYDTPSMILDISLNSPHQQMPPPPRCTNPLDWLHSAFWGTARQIWFSLEIALGKFFFFFWFFAWVLFRFKPSSFFGCRLLQPTLEQAQLRGQHIVGIRSWEYKGYNISLWGND